MAQIILPPEVILGQQIDAQLERMARLRERHGFLSWFDRELKLIDPRLSLVKANESPDQSALVPGAWHIRRDNEATMPTYIPILTEDGRPREPVNHDLEELKKADMQRPGAFAEFCRRQEQKILDQRLDRERAQEARVDEIVDRIKHHENVSVGYDRKWTNSTRGRRAA